MLHLALGADGPLLHIQAGRDAGYAIDTPLRFDLDAERVRLFHPASGQAIV